MLYFVDFIRKKISLEKNGSYMKLFHRFVELLYVCKMVMSFLLVL